MKILILIVIICLYAFMSEAQIKAIQAKPLSINFDKTLHLVFSENIKYFNKGSEDVLCSRIDEVHNVLKIKANNENFTEETNITAITTTGAFYSFSIGYKKNITGSTILYVDKDSVLKPEIIPICASKDAHLIFPARIKYSDIGNEQLVEMQKIEASNIIRFKADYENIPETNLSVLTEDGKFYNFNLEFCDNPENFNYVIGNKESKAILGNNDENTIAELSQKAIEQERSIYYIGLSKNKMEFYCSNIFIQDDILLFCCGIKNQSNINFNSDFVKCFIKDLKRLKNTVIQETEMIPLIMYNFQEVVSSKQEIKFALAFNKFTIPDKKKFEVEIFDKDGGRHIRFRIKNDAIIKATKLN